jgi:carbon starvation protein
MCVATTILVKMGRARYVWVTLVPLSWLVAVTFTASYQKVFNANPRIGFLAHAQQLAQEAPSNAARAHELSRLIFNDRLDAAVTAILVLLVCAIVVEGVIEWSRVLTGKKQAVASETPFVPTRFAPEEV